jgi:lipoprotein-anchoring transpeptidase ErfK/SrfK
MIVARGTRVLGTRMMGIRASQTDVSRLRTRLEIVAGVVAVALMTLSGTASAQYYPASPGPYYRPYGAAPPLPPEEIDAAEPPLPGAASPHVAAPPAYPPAAYPPAAYPPPPYEDRAAGVHPRQALPPEPPVYGRLPAPGPRPEEWQGGPRPPGDVDNAATAGVIPHGPMPPAAVGALPPEYQAEQGQPKELPPHLRRQEVFYPTKEPAGTIVIDTPNTYLYLVLGKDRALRYGIGVGREGFTWAGRERISRVAEWPDWTPPKEMIERQPYLPRFMAGGATNPLGARALYLGSTVYRIHGTNQPSTIGSFVSSGCIRLINSDIEDLYKRVQVGTRVVVLPGPPSRTSASSQPTVTR